jgi:MFS family permease
MSADQTHKARTLWLSGALHGFTHSYQIALVPLYLLIQKDFKLASVGEATLLVTVMGIAYFLPAYPMGAFADRHSRKKLLAIGLAINGAGFIGLGFAQHYAAALAWVVVAGFGGSFYHPAATALVARLYPARTGKALGLVAIGASAGYFLSPIYSGWRAEMTGNWRAPVIELGAMGFICAGIFYWLADEEREAAPTPARARPAEKLFPTRTLWCFFLTTSFFFSLRDFAGSGMSSLGSLFLQKAEGFNPQKTGFIVSGIFLASAVSNPVFGRLSDGGRVRWTTLLLVLAAVMVFIFPRVPGNWLFVVLMAYGFFFLASYPVVEAAVMESVPDAVRGRVFGIFITFGGLLGNVAHWAAGAMVKRMGPDASAAASYFLTYGFLALLLLLSLTGLPGLHAIRKREGLEPHVAPRLSRPAPALE